MRIQKVSISWYGLVVGSGMMLLLALLMLCPIVPEGANATDGASVVEGEESTPSVQADSTVSEPSISMALSARTELDVTPTTSGTFQASTAKLQVAVSLPSNYEAEGYKVYLKSNTSDNKLKGTGSNSASINPVSNNTSKASFQKNTWGYSLYKTGSATTDTAIYQPVPTSGTVVDNSTDLTGTYDLAFATKIDTSIPADQYSNSVLVSVVAEPELVAGLLTITNMQEMTSAICSKSKEGDTKQLIDTRDNQKYWVAKMKDGNCWMTQNLALDITTAGLKASDTDIARDWTATQSADPSVTTVYKPTATYTSVTEGSASNTATGSWNLSGIGKNEWIVKMPLKISGCGDVTEFSRCSVPMHIDDTWDSTFEAEVQGDSYISGSSSERKYDAHYLIGNYYQWNTATAGTGGTIINRDAIGSICPKGWQLPGASTSTHPTFDNLLSEYGVNENASTTGSNAMPDIENGLYNIAAAPLYFMRGGVINPDQAKLKLVGTDGHYWSPRVRDAGRTYSFVFSSAASVKPDDFTNQYMGCTVRCVAR